MRIYLNICCDKTAENTRVQDLRFDYEKSRIYTDENVFAQCFSCGKNLSGTAVIECLINEETGCIETQEEYFERHRKKYGGTLLCGGGVSTEDLTGMSE